MSKSHPAHDKAEHISKHVPEVAAIYQALGMRSYYDGKYSSFGLPKPEGYDPHRLIQEDIERRKEQIDEILYYLSCNEIENEGDFR